MKKVIAWPVAWALYWMGDSLCRSLQFWRSYKRLMTWSAAVQDWGGGGPWEKIDSGELKKVKRKGRK